MSELVSATFSRPTCGMTSTREGLLTINIARRGALEMKEIEI
jgi:hypothetical protein